MTLIESMANIMIMILAILGVFKGLNIMGITDKEFIEWIKSGFRETPKAKKPIKKK